MGVVTVDHDTDRMPVIGRLEVALEELLLALPVVLHGLVVVEVVVTQVGEHGHIENASRHPGKIQGMGGDLHDRMGDAVIDHLPENRLQVGRFRRGHRIGEDLAGITVVDRPDHAHGHAGRLQDPLHQIGDRGLAAGAGHTDEGQLMGRVSVKSASQPGQGLPCVVDPQGHRIDRHRPAADHRHGPARHRIAYKPVPVNGKPLNGHEHGTRNHLA